LQLYAFVCGWVAEMAEPSYQELLLENQQLRQQVADLQAKLADVTRLLDEARRAGKRQAAPFRKGPPKPNPKTPGRKAGDAHGRHGHRPPPAAQQIDEVLEATLPDSCPCCGGPVVETTVTQQFQTEIPRTPLHRQFTIHVGQCQQCGQRVQGRHPLQTSDALGAAASQIGPDAQAAVATLNKQAGLSHGKVAACLEALFGIELSRGASAQITVRAGERLEPVYEEIRQATRAADTIVADETGWRVGGQPAWLHVWVTDQATCYAVDRRRSADALEDLLGLDWEGWLIHDGYSTYDRFTEAVHQQCLAHLLRRAREMLEDARGGGVRFPRQVIDLFTGAIHLRNEYQAGRVAAAVLECARDDYEERLLRLLQVPRVASVNAKLAGHLYNHFESWFSFLTTPRLPATNWAAEQAIRPAVVNRKVWGGNRTDAGAAAQGILTSVLETCKKQTVSALNFISSSLCAFGNALLPRPVLLAPR
jgi:transposase